MPTTTNELPLRKVDRDRLLRLLGHLANPDPGRRAQAALDAAELLRSKGRTWGSLVPVEYGNAEPSSEPFDWRAVYGEMLGHPEVTLAEMAKIRKIRAWRAPGAAELEWLEDIGRRIGMLEEG